MEIPDELRIDEKKAVDYTVKWVRDYFKPFKTKKAIVGLSGGSDSSFTAYICRLALGKNNVFGVIMPSDSNSKKDEEDGYAVAKAIDIKTKKIDISPIMKAVEEANPELKEEKKQNCKGKYKSKAKNATAIQRSK